MLVIQLIAERCQQGVSLLKQVFRVELNDHFWLTLVDQFKATPEELDFCALDVDLYQGR